MSSVMEVAVIALLLLLNGFFAMSELAIVSSRKARLAADAADGRKGSRVALQLADDPGRFLSSVQIGITLVGILAGAFGGATLARTLAAALADAPVIGPYAEAAALAVVVGAITYASVIIGELVPKHVALANPERIAALVARPMAAVAVAAAPLVWLLEASSRLVLTLLGVSKADRRHVTEEEVKALIIEGAESGAIEPEEKEMMAGVLRLGGRRIRGLMTPRHEIEWVDLAWDADTIRAKLKASHHSRYPVCRGNPDDVLGVLQAKDLLNACLEGGMDVAALVQPIEAVHDNSPALGVLDVLKHSPIHMALVVDEYGSVEGIVTATDLLAAIVGTLSEHGEEYEPEIAQRADGSWLMDGDVPVDLAADRLGLRRLEAEGEFSTLAGFFISLSRTIPSPGDHVSWGGWRFEVMDMDGRRIDKLLVQREEREGGATE